MSVTFSVLLHGQKADELEDRFTFVRRELSDQLSDLVDDGHADIMLDGFHPLNGKACQGIAPSPCSWKRGVVVIFGTRGQAQSMTLDPFDHLRESGNRRGGLGIR